MVLHPDLASLTVNQFDGRNLLWRSVIRYGTCKIWYWPLLMTLAVARLQILDDVSNLIQTRMRNRLRLTTTGRFPTTPRLERLGTPIDRRWLASNQFDVRMRMRIEPRQHCGAHWRRVPTVFLF